MSDDLDELLRRAMSTLDREVPDGYFDALPGRTLARLDGPPELDDLDALDELARERAARSARSQPAPPEALGALDPPAADAPRSAATAAAHGGVSPHAAPGSVLDAAPRTAPDAVSDARVRGRPRRAIVAIGAGLAAAVLVLLLVSPQMRMAMSPPRPRGNLPEASLNRGGQDEATRTLSRSQPDPVIVKPDPAAPVRSPLPAPAPAPEPSAPGAQSRESPESPASRGRSPEPPALRAPSLPPAPRAPSRSPVPAPPRSSPGVIDASASDQAGAPEPAPPPEFDGATPPGSASSTETGAGRTPPPSIAHFTAAPEPSAADVELAMRLLSSKLEACVRGATGKILVDATMLPSGRMSAVRLSPPFAGTPREACVRGVVESLHFPSWTGSPRTYRFAIAVPEVLSIPQARPPGGAGPPP